MGRKAVITVGVVVFVLVAAAVFAALYFTVIKGDDDDDKGNGTSTGTPTQPTHTVVKMSVKGQWGDWDPWSECSASCEGGTLMRHRHCNDPAPENGGADCVGKSQESRPCAEWDCPDCNRPCSNGGTLVECSLCQCDGELASGKVRDLGTNRPLADVDVYVIGHEWESLATTNRRGEFRLEDLCVADLELKFVKKGYMAEAEKYSVSAGQTLTVKLTEMVKPAFTVQPQDLAIFTTDMIFLTCRATGIPEPTLYEWFKDGDVIEHSPEDGLTNVLKITNAEESHQGAYACRATSPAGKKFSRTAKVIVGTGEDTCNSTPMKNVVSLPPTCVLGSSGVTSLDAGRCGSDTCRVLDPSSTSLAMCCGPTSTETLVAKCDGFEYSVEKVKTCGCAQCEETGEVVVEGLLVTIKDGVEKALTRNVQLKVNGQEFWVDGGVFTWTGTPTDETVTVVFEPEFRDPYLGTISVVRTSPGTDTYRLPITLSPRPKPDVIDATEGAVVKVGGMDPAADVIIPANAIVDEQGNPFRGDVNIYASFTDPRVEDSIASAPGEFTFEDEEGVTRGLETFGVLGVEARTMQGEKLYLSGKADFNINSTSLGIPETKEGQPDAFLWVLDPVTGMWKKTSTLKNGTQSPTQRKPGTSGASEFPPNIPFINIDKPLLRGRQCYVSVYVYVDKNTTEGLLGQRVTIYTKDLTATRYLGRSAGSTDTTGKVCLPLPCGLKHELVVHSGYGPVTSASHHLPDGFRFENTHGNTRVAFTSPSIEDVIDGSGPVHKYAFNTCPSSDGADYHFQFYMRNLPKPGRLHVVEPKPNKSLSWFNKPSNSTERSACMIGVQVLIDDPTEVEVIGQSYQHDVNGALYGTYTTGIRQMTSYYVSADLTGNYLGCVQVKCPGKIYDGETRTTMEDVHTYVKVNLATRNNSQCNLIYTNLLPEYANQDTFYSVNFDVLTNSSLGLDIQDLTYDKNTVGSTRSRRYYENGFNRASGTYNSASRRALLRCLYNQRYVATFDCADGKYVRNTGSGANALLGGWQG